MGEIIQAILSLLETNLGSEYTYYFGEVKVPAKTNFPLIEVYPASTVDMVTGTGGMRTIECDVKVCLKVHRKDYFDGDTSRKTVKFMEDLIRRMEQRDVHGVPTDSTILGIIQKNSNLQLGGAAHITDPFHISYQETPYGDSYIGMAELSLKATRLL